jgi:4-hydroxy-4-methyl-2-oxoglutarate aldolase
MEMTRIGYRMNGAVARPDDELVKRVGAYWSCDLSDAMNGAQTMTGLRSVAVPGARIAGPAVTVNSIAPSINAGKMGLAQCKPGDVLVVAAPSAVHHAVWGSNLAYGTKSRGVAALIVDGAVRDVSQLREVGLPVFAREIVTAAAPVHSPKGEVNVPIACGGVVVFPGDIIVADEDGIVVVPSQSVEQVLAEADAVKAKAESVQEMLGRGEVTNLAGIRGLYAADGFDVD